MCVYKAAEFPAVFFFNMYIAHMCVYMYLWMHARMSVTTQTYIENVVKPCN